MFDALTASEQTCISGALGDKLESSLRQLVASEEETAKWEASIFSCLAPETARAVYLGGVLLAIKDGGVDLSESEASCLRELLADEDAAALVADPAAAIEISYAMIPCVPALLLDEGIELSEDEASCLRVAFADIDEDFTDAEFAEALSECGVDDHASSIEGATATTVGELTHGALDYNGDTDLFAFDAEEGVLYQIDVRLGTLPDSALTLYDSEEWQLAYNDDHGDSRGSRILWEAPTAGEYYAEVDGYDTGSYTLTVAVSDIVDDYANSIEGATAATVGAAIQGALDYEGDIDVFAFEAEEGVLYQIDAELGTLPDLWLSLHDSEKWGLDYNYDYSDQDFQGSRILWTAPSSGEFYAQVDGYDTGSYTLTVSVSDIVDDHANSFGAATAGTVGAAIQGALDYNGDIDLFVIDAEVGVLYQIDVELGNLPDSWLVVYDSEEFEVAFNDDSEDSPASRILGKVPAAGQYYLEVGGYGTGSYTLTVSVSDIVDDHADYLAERVAPVTVDEPVQGALEYEGDIDSFLLEAEEGVLYRIDVELGTLPDSALGLYDSEEFELAYNDDREDSLASRIEWEAPASGEYYVVVGGFGTGSYTLTVTALESSMT